MDAHRRNRSGDLARTRAGAGRRGKSGRGRQPGRDPAARRRRLSQGRRRGDQGGGFRQTDRQGPDVSAPVEALHGHARGAGDRRTADRQPRRRGGCAQGGVEAADRSGLPADARSGGAGCGRECGRGDGAARADRRRADRHLLRSRPRANAADRSRREGGGGDVRLARKAAREVRGPVAGGPEASRGEVRQGG